MADDHQSLLEDMINLKDRLPKRQRHLCDYVLKHYQSLGLITVKELSHESGVGVSTVMRTIHSLGYSNFNDFRKDVYDESLTEKTNSKWKLKDSLSDVQENKEYEHTLVQVCKESVNLLDKSLNEDLMENFDKTIDMMSQATCINIFGTRPYKIVALYFEQVMGEFYPKIRQLSHDSEVVLDKALQIEKDEALIVFAFEPYTERIIQATKVAHDLGVPIILITDHISCPIINYATTILKIEVSEDKFSIVPTIALVEALIVEFGRRFSDDFIEKLSKLERTLKEHRVTFSY
ncbi:MurR/RpiR family transcriptional regulator [Natribacillus halophilus]|uniref:DNA-binding transcriptional regulator, MurR/RpiR family, contains HTH and SIS domains n=1 Tax=Natribacillus halophilus TaxID=549003 RepID=A0A1G8Q5B3_9BACI|nr:MurR/RpiR family transcriptional regulator [Natribacillus halophilus]SDI99903.1 DNA-binding transcriptional regulator, MurR/RpiR family, contains HTH and SIS domains [Natribacillus halophilus]